LSAAGEFAINRRFGSIEIFRETRALLDGHFLLRRFAQPQYSNAASASTAPHAEQLAARWRRNCWIPGADGRLTAMGGLLLGTVDEPCPHVFVEKDTTGKLELVAP
jgi:hypothetical protein